MLLRCCSFKFTCGDNTTMNETIFVNPSYPRGDNGTNTCQGDHLMKLFFNKLFFYITFY